jgi:hypothetical protein
MRMASRVRPFVVLLAAAMAASSSGCAAGRSSYFLLTAERAYQASLAEGAKEKAPYEITLAGEYLKKAKEENGYADFGVSERLAKASQTFSGMAMKRARDEGVDEATQDVVPEQRIEKPVEPEKENTLDDIDLDDI